MSGLWLTPKDGLRKSRFLLLSCCFIWWFLAGFPNPATFIYFGMAVRCVNIDWLEVHAREPFHEPRDIFYFMNLGYKCEAREYGTRVYREMFTIFAHNDEALLEVRRNPASSGLNGIHDENECHLRLCNRTCYFDNASLFLSSFLSRHGYSDVRISRIDICLDFVKFDKGDEPQAFVRRYFKHKYAKINQGRIASHGEDTWSGQEWNSLSWGSKCSAVTTKLYNKTLELYDAKLDRFGKPYIREAWFRCGLIDDIQRVTKDGELVNVWRVEFSLRSAVKNWVPINLDGDDKKYQSLRNTLDVYDNREKLLVMFASLAQHYFRFKKYKPNQRKDRCPDKVLFDFTEPQIVYKIGKTDTALGSGNSFKSRYNRLLLKIKEFQSTHFGAELHKACEVLISAITEENYKADLACPWSNEELEFLKKLIFVRTTQRDLTYEAAVAEVKRLLGITDRTFSQF